MSVTDQTTDLELCTMCGEPVDHDEAHWMHEPYCDRTPGDDGYCWCDLVAHPSCCPCVADQGEEP